MSSPSSGTAHTVMLSLALWTTGAYRRLRYRYRVCWRLTRDDAGRELFELDVTASLLLALQQFDLIGFAFAMQTSGMQTFVSESPVLLQSFRSTSCGSCVSQQRNSPRGERA